MSRSEMRATRWALISKHHGLRCTKLARVIDVDLSFIRAKYILESGMNLPREAPTQKIGLVVIDGAKLLLHAPAECKLSDHRLFNILNKGHIQT